MLEKQRYPEGTPKSPEKKHGHLGLNYPEHLSKSDFLGFSKKDLTELAVMYRSKFIVFTSGNYSLSVYAKAR